MATIRKHFKKWQVLVRKKNVAVTKSFWKKSDASKWAYTEAQIETGVFRKVDQVEKLIDINLEEVFNIYFDKYLKRNSRSGWPWNVQHGPRFMNHLSEKYM